ncbi:nuclear transport factor 2 family protein [Kutzneria chonburiensis]|uniref:Nuclear transport factor 2 family protein n=1 Tax=Kutzneria chonburiensis TaxID=1483604 RepID=A0ABV6N744_9PSEU|nr:nuclear transport factor 2 family protein [Kutzneria chonburiensis]
MPAEQNPRDVATFVQQWYDLLSDHEPVERLLPMVADDGLEMAFPERTLRGHADFRDWYVAVGEAFSDQTHTVELLSSTDNGDTIDIAVTVVWEATNNADDSRSKFRVNQTWQLVKTATGPVISTYAVGDLVAI